MDKQYTINSSHGKLTTDADGCVTDRELDNDEPDGGAHLARIIRFDLEEWRQYWGDPEPYHIDILSLGYWYTDPKTGDSAHEPPDAKWRAEIAQELFGRNPARGTGGVS